MLKISEIFCKNGGTFGAKIFTKKLKIFSCSAPHDQSRGFGCVEEVQVFRLWKGFQIQASFKGKLNSIFAIQIWIDIYKYLDFYINISRYLGISDITYVCLLFHRSMFFLMVFSIFYFYLEKVLDDTIFPNKSKWKTKQSNIKSLL